MILVIGFWLIVLVLWLSVIIIELTLPVIVRYLLKIFLNLKLKHKLKQRTDGLKIKTNQSVT
ncbi:MAG: hypothetical protein JETCAE03_26010 [Ignavibacteriaceae bacterium]|nr:MAG: hypothetical protein BroJett017_10980 [Ignavibacteriota bacterium]GJQ43103.1 MAG: hypothetical protein JETCAE03_26010 [Ignavibacteriaceae bacterium]